jgi:hypothetical protein
MNIRVGTTDFKHAMSLIWFILAKSSSLKIIAFKVDFGHKKLDPAVLLSISQNLLPMERASQKARVEFTHRKIDFQLWNVFDFSFQHHNSQRL